MIRVILLTLALLLASSPSNAASPIRDLVDLPVPIRPDGSRYSVDEVRAAIIKGSQSRLWTAKIEGETTIRARLNVKNKHYAIVEIPFSESAYSIIYVSSTNLDYNPDRRSIHRNYNKWVLQLSTMINQAFYGIETDNFSAEFNSDCIGVDLEEVFEELLKLDDLRDRGILTQEEFETEKLRLLEL